MTATARAASAITTLENMTGGGRSPESRSPKTSSEIPEVEYCRLLSIRWPSYTARSGSELHLQKPQKAFDVSTFLEHGACWERAVTTLGPDSEYRVSRIRPPTSDEGKRWQEKEQKLTGKPSLEKWRMHNHAEDMCSPCVRAPVYTPVPWLRSNPPHWTQVKRKVPWYLIHDARGTVGDRG